MYESRPAPEIRSLDELRRYVEEEFKRVEESLVETTAVDLRPVNVAPTRPRDGMLIYADGVNFNPGAGAGTYERRGGAWVKL